MATVPFTPDLRGCAGGPACRPQLFWSYQLAFKNPIFSLETPVCFERTLAQYRAAHSESLVGSPNETQNGTSVGVTHGVGGYRETEYGERVVIATERKE